MLKFLKTMTKTITEETSSCCKRVTISFLTTNENTELNLLDVKTTWETFSLQIVNPSNGKTVTEKNCRNYTSGSKTIADDLVGFELGAFAPNWGTDNALTVNPNPSSFRSASN